MKNSTMAVVAILAGMLIADVTQASLSSYTDRTTFDGVVVLQTIEDFESYATDTPFHSSVVDVGDFTLSMSGAPDTSSYNYIDIAPAATSESDVNGSTNMRVFTDGAASANLTFLFDAPIKAFGADFRSLNDQINRTELVIGSDVLSLPVTTGTGLFTFFGFTSDTAFTSVTFKGLQNDVYGVDNVTYSAIPEPASLGLLGLVTGGIYFARRFFIA